LLTEQDIYLFREGTHASLFDDLGCHFKPGGGASFAVWAPNAAKVSVIGDWNGWGAREDALTARWDGSGIWEGSIADVQHGQAYKYRIVSRWNDFTAEKADPVGFFSEAPPATGSRVWSLEWEWRDGDWMASRGERNGLAAPISIYEAHLGSWRRRDGNFLNYRELAHELGAYLSETGFTHVELMPITEHPFYGSWGYQTTGYFAATSRYGTPQDLMYFVDHLHQKGIGVILDWVPSHFPTDAHGLNYFDGTHLYEHADSRQGFHPEWNSAIFNYGRNEVRAFLISSADAVPGLRAQGRRVDSKPLRRTREPGGDRVPAGVEQGRVPASSRRHHDRRGIHRLADGLTADRHGRPRLRH
jgi:1,4-alpha-glucan branching enzyme